MVGHQGRRRGEMNDSRIVQKLAQARAREQQRLRAGADATVAGWQCFYAIVLNSLFAMPPYAAGIDVYEEGRLLAGYSYRTIDECRDNLPGVIRTYFKSGAL